MKDRNVKKASLIVLETFILICYMLGFFFLIHVDNSSILQHMNPVHLRKNKAHLSYHNFLPLHYQVKPTLPVVEIHEKYRKNTIQFKKSCNFRKLYIVENVKIEPHEGFSTAKYS